MINLNKVKIGYKFICKNERILQLVKEQKDIQNDYHSRFEFESMNGSIITLYYNQDGVINTNHDAWEITKELDKEKYPEYFL